MKKQHIILFICTLILSGSSTIIQAQNTVPLLCDFQEIGQLKTRHANDIVSSTWSVGGETLDRDFTDYHSYKEYLGPLGAKRIRLQGGWMKCEPEKGSYNFLWLDEIVNDAYSQGVSPWIELAYGNPNYEGGDEARLGGALPSSQEALNAWDNWVRAMVTRYKGKVTEWEIWNEPDHGKDVTGKSYGLFFIRTAKLVKDIQPESIILGGALSSVNNTDFVTDFYETLKENQAMDLLDLFVYHAYFASYGLAYNPDDVYPQVEAMRQLIWSYDPKVVFFQGESGAPSTPNPGFGVFKEYGWSELNQSKWDLRRMLGDHGRGINTSLFAISDMHYNWGDPTKKALLNSKGILSTNEDRTIKRPKMMYKAAQQVFSLFDDQLQRDSMIIVESNQCTQSVFTWKQLATELSLIAIWQNEYPPYETYKARSTTLVIKKGNFKKPVFVDLISGKIYEIPTCQWKKSGKKYIFIDIPVPDYPVLIVDYGLVN